MSASGPRIGVAWKWQSLRPEIDRRTGAPVLDERFMGSSDADQAALECGLRLAEAWGGEVTVACAGPAAAEGMLRSALAAGAARAVRCALEPDAPSATAAAALAGALAGFDVVLCGHHSVDRASGSVPALLAAELGAAQALGLVRLEAEGPGSVLAERRLDGGRRERLRARAPAVLSVEGGAARLRRAALDGVLHARDADVAQVAPPEAGGHAVHHRGRLRPYRPRPRALDPPDPALGARERILSLTGATAARGTRQVVSAEPGEAAERLLAALRAWGYLE